MVRDILTPFGARADDTDDPEADGMSEDRAVWITAAPEWRPVVLPPVALPRSPLAEALRAVGLADQAETRSRLVMRDAEDAYLTAQARWQLQGDSLGLGAREAAYRVALACWQIDAAQQQVTVERMCELLDAARQEQGA